MWDVKPGDLVVCIEPPLRPYVNKKPIIVGQIYTVSEVYAGYPGRLGLFLEGFPPSDWCWDIIKFRAVAKPSIENLRQLTTKPDLVKENA